MDLRDVMHRRDAIIELAEPPEQFVDVHVLRPVNGRELLEDVFEVSPAPAWRARAIDYENAVSEPAAQRRLELVVMRIDKAWHDDAAARIDHCSGTGAQIRSNSLDLVALDKDVALREVADLGIHRHHRTATNDVTGPGRAGAWGRTDLRRGRTRRE